MLKGNQRIVNKQMVQLIQILLINSNNNNKLNIQAIMNKNKA